MPSANIRDTLMRHWRLMEMPRCEARQKGNVMNQIVGGIKKSEPLIEHLKIMACNIQTEYLMRTILAGPIIKRKTKKLMV